MQRLLCKMLFGLLSSLYVIGITAGVPTAEQESTSSFTRRQHTHVVTPKTVSGLGENLYSYPQPQVEVDEDIVIILPAQSGDIRRDGFQPAIPSVISPVRLNRLKSTTTTTESTTSSTTVTTTTTTTTTTKSTSTTTPTTTTSTTTATTTSTSESTSTTLPTESTETTQATTESTTSRTTEAPTTGSTTETTTTARYKLPSRRTTASSTTTETTTDTTTVVETSTTSTSSTPVTRLPQLTSVNKLFRRPSPLPGLSSSLFKPKDKDVLHHLKMTGSHDHVNESEDKEGGRDSQEANGHHRVKSGVRAGGQTKPESLAPNQLDFKTKKNKGPPKLNPIRLGSHPPPNALAQPAEDGDDASREDEVEDVSEAAVENEAVHDADTNGYSESQEDKESDEDIGLPASGSNQTRKIRDNSHWKEMYRFTLTSGTPVMKYRSDLTGITVVLAKAESPIVNGYFCLATEAHDNDGLPHTLEHLIFLGSEDYPYKDALDLLANRCLADRTNAWTDTDHTCYTVYTAGSSGFLQILPIYLDHILFPLLKEGDYLTEVHHINGEGHDAGVVYSEMQGVERSSSNILYYYLADILYPGNSGYASETGGYLRNLRNSTSIEKVRQYHKEFYRPENLVLTMTGKVEESELFTAMRKIEDKILSKRQSNPPAEYQRPWQTPLKKIPRTQSLINEVKYPAEDETLGNVVVAWRLSEKISSNIERNQAYELILKYLATTEVSPLEREFVESDDPIATSVSGDMLEVREPSILLEFENVPIQRLDEVLPRMEASLKSIVEDKDSFDLDRMHNFIDREVVNNLKETENSPHLFLPDGVLLDMLYGEKPEHLEQFVMASQLNGNLRNKTASYWIRLINDTFINNEKYVVKGIPSIQKLKEENSQEEARIEEQIQRLGEDGLKKMEEKLDAAVAAQTLPSKQVLQKISMGEISAIRFRPFTPLNRTNNQGNLVNLDSIPFKVHFDDVQSKFVQFYIFFNTSILDSSQRMYLPLLMGTWLVAPQEKDGKVTSLDEVVKMRTSNLLQIHNSLGFDGSTFSPGANGDAIVIEAQSTMGKFEDATRFIGDAINYPQFLAQKINSTAGILLNKIPTKKQSPSDILSLIYDGLYFDNTSNINRVSFLRQKAFLEDVVNRLDRGDEGVISEMMEIVEMLAKPEHAFLYLATDIKTLVSEYGKELPVLQSLFPTQKSSLTKEQLKERYDIRSESSYRKKFWDPSQGRHILAGVSGTETCYMKQYILYNDTDWYNPQVTPIRVMLQYLTDRMYDEVRGQGLTYGVSMALSVTEGRMSMTFTRSSRLVDAYGVVRNILERYVDNPAAWDPTLLDSARGSLIYSWAEKEETIEDLINQSIKSYMRNTDNGFNRQFVMSLDSVDIAQVKAAAAKFLPRFLDPESTHSVIVCNPSSVGDIVAGFEAFGVDLSVYRSIEELEANPIFQWAD